MTTSRVELRRATREDIETFKGDRELGPSLTAIVGLVDGVPVGLGGFAHVRGRMIAFCDLKPEARKHRKHIHKAALMAMSMAREAGYRFVYAEADRNEPTAERWLTRLGFEHIGDGRYRWPN